MTTLPFDIDPETGCHLFIGPLRKGYGYVRDGGKARQAHVVAWEREKGPVPVGLELDHYICNVKRCINLDHLEPVTHAENVGRANKRRAAAMTRCKNGHEFPKNAYVRANGRRQCRVCKADYQRRSRRAAKSALGSVYGY